MDEKIQKPRIMTKESGYQKVKGPDCHYLVKRPGSKNIYVRATKIKRHDPKTGKLKSLFQSARTDDKAKAKDIRDKLLLEITGQVQKTTTRITFDELHKEYLSIKIPRIKQGKRSTEGQYIYPWRRLTLMFGKLFVDEFNSSHWDSFMAQTILEEKGKIKFFNFHKLMTGLLNYALRAEYINKKPKLALDKRREKPEEIVLWTHKQYLQLLKNSEGDLHLKIDMAYQTGMRPIEINMLKKCFIDIPGKMIRLPKDYSKTGDPRNVPVLAPLMLKIKKQVLTSKEPTLFESAQPDSHDEPFQALKKSIGYDNIFYNFRHTCAVRMVKAGIPIGTACKIIGNDIGVFMDRYFKPSDKDLQDEIKKMREV